MASTLVKLLKRQPRFFASAQRECCTVLSGCATSTSDRSKDTLHSSSRATAACEGSSFPSAIGGEELQQYDTATQRKILVNRLLYRSKQRGFLEMDLLVGLWAQQNVPKADDAMLVAFEQVLDQENPDLYKWLTGQDEPPMQLRQNEAFKVLQESVGLQLRETVQEAARTRPGKEWVRGWDDWKKETRP